MATPTITTIEDAVLNTISELDLFATIQSCGRREVPAVYAWPACFIYFDGDEEVAAIPRPVDDARFKVVIQSTNLGGEDQAARDSYSLNDAVRAALRGKSLGLDMEPLACESRICTDYQDDVGMIEYTHTYRTRLYQPVVVS